MKQLLRQYAEYNLWANSRILDAILLLNYEQQHKEIESSFNSLYKTIFHVRGSEIVWLSRLNKKPNISKVDDTFNGSMKELGNAWIEIDKQILDFVNNVSEEFLKKKLNYQNMKGDPFHDEIYLILQHVFNHCTYHRGQLVTMLRQAGAEQIPGTDFIAWARIMK